MEVAVAGVEHVPDPEAVLLGQLVDPPEHGGQLRPGHDAVLHVVVRRHAPHRRERALAPEPEERALRRVARRPDLEGARREAQGLDRGRVQLRLRRDPVELDEEDGSRAFGVPRAVRLLGRLDREPIHDLHRRGQDSRGDDPRHGVARGVDRREGGELRDDDLRLADDAERDLDGDPERALRADDHAEQVGPVAGVHRLAAERQQLPVGQDDACARHVVHREPVLQAVRPARVLGQVAADRADLLARRIRGVEVALRRDGPCDVEVRDAGLDDDALALEVDLEDPVHPRDRDDDSLGDRQRAAREAGARAPGDERDAVAGAEPKDGLDVLRRARAGRRLPASPASR